MRTLFFTFILCAAIQSFGYAQPTAQCRNITVYLDAMGSTTVYPADIDNGSTNAALYYINGQSSQIYTHAHLGAQAAILTVEDAMGDTDVCSAVVLVLDTFPSPCTAPDNIPPVALCQNQSLSLAADGTASLAAAMIDDGSTDNCSVVSLSVNGAPNIVFDCADLGTHTVVLTVTDTAGNSSNCSAQVILIDNIAPSVVCYNNTVYLSSTGTAAVLPTQIATAIDACMVGGWSINGQPQMAFSCADLGAHIVSVAAADVAGNTSSCQAQLTVVDTVAPMPACQNAVAYLDSTGIATIQPTDIYLSGVDYCGVDSFWVAADSFDCNDMGNLPVLLYMSDISGNIGTCTAQVHILDTLSPTVQCAHPTLYLDANGTASLAASQLVLFSSDNCSIVNVMADNQSALLFSCAHVGVLPIVLTVWDNAGNAGTCISDVTVLDTFSLCPLTGQLITTQPVYCGTTACVGAAEVQGFGGTPPYSFLWSDGGTNRLRTDLCAGWHSVTIADVNSQTVVLSAIAIGYQTGCVWPGDTDDDADVDNMDMLPIALAFGDIGLPRPNASIAWMGQPAPDWNTALPGLPDHKFIDANGDGMIGNTDVDVVRLNYQQNYLRNNTNRSTPGNIPLYADSILVDEGDRIGIPIRLGRIASLADSVYAIAFTIEYDPTYVEANSLGMDYANSWLGLDLLHLEYEHTAAGRLDVMIGRKDRMPITGFNEIGTCSMTIIEDVLRRSNDSIVCMPIVLSNVRLINHRNEVRGTQETNGEVCINLATGVQLVDATQPSAALSLYPNPTPARFTLDLRLDQPQAVQIRVSDLLGRVVYSAQHHTAALHTELDGSTWGKGIYIVQVLPQQGQPLTQRITLTE